MGNFNKISCFSKEKKSFAEIIIEIIIKPIVLVFPLSKCVTGFIDLPDLKMRYTWFKWSKKKKKKRKDSCNAVLIARKPLQNGPNRKQADFEVI